MLLLTKLDPNRTNVIFGFHSVPPQQRKRRCEEGERDRAFISPDSLSEKIWFDLRDRVAVELVSGQEITV